MFQIIKKFMGTALVAAMLLACSMTAWADGPLSDGQKTEEQTQQTQQTVQASPHIWYQVFQDGAWGHEVQDKTPASQSSRSAIEGVKVRLEGVEGGVSYRVYLQNGGWQGWVSDGAAAGGENTGNPVEAIQIKLKGYASQVLEVVYRASMIGGDTMGWAKSGSAAGAVGQGLNMYSMDIYLSGINGYQEKGDALRTDLPYGFFQENGIACYTDTPGLVYSGWFDYEGARYYAKDNVLMTGWQYIDGLKFYFDLQHKLVQDLDSVIGIQSSYVIKINKELNCLTIYAKDGANGYVIPVKSMLCSVGDDTPLGTFHTPEKYRWRLMVNDTYTQYATRITAGQGFLIHSICYDKPDIYTMQSVGYNGLGVVRSLGCIRLTAVNAKWVYDNCAIGTTIEIYEDPSNVGPFYKPTVTPIPEDQTFDPTDPLVSEEVKAEGAKKTEALKKAKAAEAAAEAAAAEAARAEAAQQEEAAAEATKEVGPGV